MKKEDKTQKKDEVKEELKVEDKKTTAKAEPKKEELKPEDKKKEEKKEAKKETKEKPVAKTKEKAVKPKKKVDYSHIYDKEQAYPISEAVAIVRKLTKTKFDSSLEVHFRLGISNKKSDQQIRSTVSLPHGTGKTIRIAAFVSPSNEEEARKAGADLVGGEDLIEEIKKTEKTDFQVAVAEPAMMRNLGVIAKILGTRGLMPSPKSETVSPNPAKTIAELKKGKIGFKNDENSNLHSIIGKMSFSDDQLIDNYKVFTDNLLKLRPASLKGDFIQNISISSTMSPGVKVSL